MGDSKTWYSGIPGLQRDIENEILDGANASS
jgi:hypothetical protein